MSRYLQEWCLTDRKIDLTFRLYVDPGDEDYVAARWAYSSGLFHVFYWCAAQACEKYMKAFMLLQDDSVSEFGHDLVGLFQAVRSRDVNSTIPSVLDIPETTAMGRHLWHEKPVSLYVDYLNVFGSSDNRYAFNGTFVNGPVLHALDILCCALRRLMRGTNFTSGDLFKNQSINLALHDQIPDDQDWMIDPRLLLERLFVGRYQVGQDDALRGAFSRMNLAFFSERTEGESNFGGQHFHGSPLHNHLVRLAELELSPQNREVVEQLRDWASRNIHMSSRVRARLGFARPRRRP